MYACFRLIMTKSALVKARYEDSRAASMQGSDHANWEGAEFSEVYTSIIQLSIKAVKKSLKR